MAYGQTAEVLEHLLGLSLSTSVLKRLVERDGKEVVAFYREGSESRSEEPILVVQADGKGVPMRPSAERPGSEKRESGPDPVRLGKGQKRTKKKEAVVTSLYATDRRVRTAEEVLDSFFSPPNASSKTSSRAGPRSEEAQSEEAQSEEAQDGASQNGEVPNGTGPESQKESQNKKVWATLEGKEVALARLAWQVRKREESSRHEESSISGSSITDRVALSDGCRALQDQLCEQFPRFELILDFVHVSEYLWGAANALFEETSEARLEWVIERSRELLTGQHEAVLARLHEGSTHPEDACSRAARYFERNAERMEYKRYLENGWPIATGVIEGACRHLVKDRCETSGMRWCREGAEQILGLRSVWTNGDWDAYHRRRRKQRHCQLYGHPLETTDTLEEQMWRMAA